MRIVENKIVEDYDTGKIVIQERRVVATHVNYEDAIDIKEFLNTHKRPESSSFYVLERDRS